MDTTSIKDDLLNKRYIGIPDKNVNNSNTSRVNLNRDKTIYHSDLFDIEEEFYKLDR